MVRFVYTTGDEHEVAAEPSIEHLKIAPVSADAKIKVACAERLGFAGADEIVTNGACVSTVHESMAGAEAAMPFDCVKLSWNIASDAVERLKSKILVSGQVRDRDPAGTVTIAALIPEIATV